MLHHILILLALGISAFIAGIIDTLAGGGGLITVPALISAGLPAVVVLGTNRLQTIFGEMTASIHFLKQKKINFKQIRTGLIITALASIIGSYIATIIDSAILENALPFLLLGVLIYTIFSPSAKDINTKARLKPITFFCIFSCVIGFYNGFFGPPTGSFWMFSLMCFLGLDIVSANMNAKPLNVIGNIASMFVFLIGGHINFTIGFTMGIGQVLGARIGAHLVIHKGQKLIKPVYITVVSIMIIDVFVKTYLH